MPFVVLFVKDLQHFKLVKDFEKQNEIRVCKYCFLNIQYRFLFKYVSTYFLSNLVMVYYDIFYLKHLPFYYFFIYSKTCEKNYFYLFTYIFMLIYLNYLKLNHISTQNYF